MHINYMQNDIEQKFSHTDHLGYKVVPPIKVCILSQFNMKEVGPHYNIVLTIIYKLHMHTFSTSSQVTIKG